MTGYRCLGTGCCPPGVADALCRSIVDAGRDPAQMSSLVSSLANDFMTRTSGGLFPSGLFPSGLLSESRLMRCCC